MKFYRLILLIFAFVTAIMANASSADDHKGSKDKEHMAERIKKEAAVIRESLHLKGDSAKRFTEIFTEYSMAIHKAFDASKCPPHMRPGEKKKSLTQEQIDKNIKARFACARAILDIRENFYNRFREVLSPSQYEEFSAIEQRIGAKKRHEHERRQMPPQPRKESKKAIRKK